MTSTGMILDLLALQSRHHSERGTARYVGCLTSELLKINGAVRRLFLNPMAPPPDTLPAEIQQCAQPLRWHTARELREAMKEGPTAYYMMSPLDLDDAVLGCPIPARIPLIATVFDLIPLLFREQYLYSAATYQRYMNRLDCMKRADLLLAISESARQDAIEHLHIHPDRIACIGTGISTWFKPATPDQAIQTTARRALGVDGPFLLSVLGHDPRKNLPRLIEAMHLLPPDIRCDLTLLVVGSYGEDAEKEIRDTPTGKALGHRLVFSGIIPDHWLLELYQQAALHVFPSLYEGFGLPAAEAAACGCPSITSNTSSLPEVLETPEATFDPQDTEDMASLIVRCLTDQAFRDHLVTRGLQVTQKHRWDLVAQRTVHAVRQRELAWTTGTSLSTPKPRFALVGPFPPTRSGIADYNERICVALKKKCRLDIFMSHRESRVPASLRDIPCYRIATLGRLLNPLSYDGLIYTMGNSEHHLETLDLARRYPGLLWLHDVQLYGLITAYANSCFPTEEAAEFLRAELHRQYGPDVPLPEDPGELLKLSYYQHHQLGMTRHLIDCANGLLLHSKHARERLQSDLSSSAQLPPTVVLPHLFPHVSGTAYRRSFSPPWTLAHFGMVDPLKCPQLLIHAFAQLKTPDDRFVFAGPIHDDIHRSLLQLVNTLGIGDRVIFTGRLTAEDYKEWIRQVDLCIQLRMYSHGESSGPVHDAIAAGTPVITNMQFACEWPPHVITMLPELPSADSLADSLLTLLHPDTLTQQSVAGLDFARRHSADQVADRLLAELDHLTTPSSPAFSLESG